MNNWSHAPLHDLGDAGAYMITSGTYRKAHLFNTDQKLDLLQSIILEECSNYKFDIQQWAVLSNHYHLLIFKNHSDDTASRLIQKIHSRSAIGVNRLDKMKGRKVWYQYWDTGIHNERAYMANLNYVLQNPVKHGIVKNAEDYRWCSAKKFRENVSAEFLEEVIKTEVSTFSLEDNY